MGAKNLALLKDEFAAWLQSRGPEAVGCANSDQACPLASYMREKGLDRAEVSKKSLTYMGRAWFRHSEPLPMWARDFVDRFDKMFEDREDGNLYVTGDEALKALR